MRAIRRARADYQALLATARAFSAAVDDAPALAAAAAQRTIELEKSYRKLAMESAERQGRDLYASTVPGPDGLRRVTRAGRIDDELRTLAQAFVAGSKAVLVAICEDPPSVLVAASKDAGLHAGNLVKSAVTAHGGRGGGSPVLGQGSVPGLEALQQVRTALL